MIGEHMPTKEQIKASRQSAGLTQLQAIRILRPGSRTARTWNAWEQDKGRDMPQELWELFLLKTKKLRRSGV